MKEFTISACRWHVDCEAQKYKQRALDHYRDCWIVLLTFLRSEGLLRNQDFAINVPDWLEFRITTEDVTDEGLALMKQCLSSWNPAYGQGHTQRHLVQWKRKLKGIRCP